MHLLTIGFGNVFLQASGIKLPGMSSNMLLGRARSSGLQAVPWAAQQTMTMATGEG